nr:hypothetical protein [Tanacetum cinerariifolium]
MIAFRVTTSESKVGYGGDKYVFVLVEENKRGDEVFVFLPSLYFTYLGEANNPPSLGVKYTVTFGAVSRVRPYHFTYPERKLAMEEMLYKLIDEGKREHEEMRAFICDFQTTNKILFKERNNSLIELRFGVQELLKVINNTPMIDCEVKGVTTRGGKTTTQDA